MKKEPRLPDNKLLSSRSVPGVLLLGAERVLVLPQVGSGPHPVLAAGPQFPYL